MKILFFNRYSSYLENPQTYKNVKKAVEESGHTFRSNIEFAEEAAQSPEDYSFKINKIKKDIDIVIADINSESTGIGYEIEWAITNKKPVLIVYTNSNSANVSTIIRAKRNRLISQLEYEKEADLVNGVKKFLTNAKNKLDTKFILIIPPEIDRYLEWASDYKRMHKAQLVREAIEAYMEKDTDWQEFLKEEE